jgi:hypothetical protein
VKFGLQYTPRRPENLQTVALFLTSFDYQKARDSTSDRSRIFVNGNEMSHSPDEAIQDVRNIGRADQIIDIRHNSACRSLPPPRSGTTARVRPPVASSDENSHPIEPSNQDFIS